MDGIYDWFLDYIWYLWGKLLMGHVTMLMLISVKNVNVTGNLNSTVTIFDYGALQSN